MFVQNLQRRKETAVATFDYNCGHMLREFRSKNRFIRLVLQFLLCLDTSQDRAGFILIKLVFGGHAADLFLNQGINNTLIDQKNQLLHQIKHKSKPDLTASDAQNVSQMAKVVRPIAKHSGSSETDSGKSLSLDPTSPVRIKIRADDLPELRLRVEALGMAKVVLLMKIYGVPFRYVDHWVWLFSNSDQEASKFLEFHALLKKVYNLNLTQRQSEFDKILDVLPAQ